jgi:type III secretion protein Q
VSAPVIKLPVLDSLTVQAYRRLGRGLRFSFEVAGEVGELLLEPGRAPECGVSLSLETRCGVMTFSDAGPLLSLMGDCPVVLADTENDPCSWFWALFEQRMSTQLVSVFGYVRPIGDVQPQTFECRASIALGQARSVSRLRMAPESLLALYESGPWHPLKASVADRFPFLIPVILGQLQVSVEQLRSVQPGDVVLLENTQLDGEGVGQLNVGKLRLHVMIDDEGARRCLNICSIEEVAVDDVFFASTDVDANAQAQRVLDEDQSLEHLPLALSVRCGALKLSLGELRQLAPGVVLNIEGYSPGMAGLYYGDRPIGLGQLVEVDGRLGLQLSRIIFSQ